MGILKLALLTGLLSVVAHIAAARADLLWGVNGHPFTAYPGITIQQQLDYVRDLGMRSYRVNISDASRASDLAKLVAEGKARGIEILPVITPSGIDLKTDTPEDLYAKSFRIAVALVSQFKNDIRTWELGNELENYAIIKPCEMRDDGVQYPCAWGPAGGVGPLEYYGPRWAKVSAVLKGLSDGTISVDPTIRKAIGTAGWGHTGAFTRMQRDGIQWDISVWHMYGNDPEWAFKILARFNRPIWVTEFNNPLGSHSGEQEQAEGLKKNIARLRQLQSAYNVEAAHVYELMDEPYWAPTYESVMGLIRVVKNSDGRWTPSKPKAAYREVKTLIRGPVALPARNNCDLDAYEKLDPARPIQLAYSYCLALGRQPDEAGHRTWVVGVTPAQLLVNMLNSSEFRNQHATIGLTNAEFVTLIYRLLFDRAPDEAGLSGYVSQLDNGTLTREALVGRIVDSDEFIAKHPILFRAAQLGPDSMANLAPEQVPAATGRRGIRECDLESFNATESTRRTQAAYSYCLILGRPGDGAGLGRWTAALNDGSTIDQMLLAMLGSDEFTKRYTASNLSNSDFLVLMYRLLVGRDPDRAGLASYLAQLDAGSLSRTGVQRGIILSNEFRTKHRILSEVPPAAPASRAN
jgi:hypothetical protein